MEFDNLNDFTAPMWGNGSSYSSSSSSNNNNSFNSVVVGDSSFALDYNDVPSMSPLSTAPSSSSSSLSSLRRPAVPLVGGLQDSFTMGDPNDWSRAMLDISSMSLPLPERSVIGGGGMPEKFSLDLDMLSSALALPLSDTAFIGLSNNNGIGSIGTSNSSFNSSNNNINNNNIINNNNSASNTNSLGGVAFPGMVRTKADSRRLFGTASPVTIAPSGTGASSSSSTSSTSSSAAAGSSVSCNNNNGNSNSVVLGGADLFDYVTDIPEELLRFDLPSEITDNLQNFSIRKHAMDEDDDDEDSHSHSSHSNSVRVKMEGKRSKTVTRRTHTRRQPTREGFSTDAEFEEELALWKRNREINNESVKRSRERLNQELATKKTELKTRQQQNADIVREIEVLRSEQMLLTRFTQSPLAIQERERSELRRILLLHLHGLEEVVVTKQEDEEDVD